VDKRLLFCCGLVGFVIGVLAILLPLLLAVLITKTELPWSRQSTTYVDHRYLFSITYKPDQNWSRSENIRGGEQGVVISRNPDISWLYDSTKPGMVHNLGNTFSGPPEKWIVSGAHRIPKRDKIGTPGTYFRACDGEIGLVGPEINSWVSKKCYLISLEN